MKKNKLNEGITKEGTPDMKYYAFDWDDNILRMPTNIVLKDDNNNEVLMSTEDFAEYRTKIGKENFNYNGHNIVGFANDAFRNFTVKGDKQFLIDAMDAKTGPAWNDFVEAVNGGSVFSIITARGHTPNVLKEGVYNLIISRKDGLNPNELVENLQKYRQLAGEENMSKKDMIREYLDMCKFYPVTYGESKVGAINPEKGKIKAMAEFISYVKEMGARLHKGAYLKNKISNNFTPTIGFSDDDIRNVESIKKHFKKEPTLKTYSTAGGKKKLY